MIKGNNKGDNVKLNKTEQTLIDYFAWVITTNVQAHDRNNKNWVFYLPFGYNVFPTKFVHNKRELNAALKLVEKGLLVRVDEHRFIMHTFEGNFDKVIELSTKG